VKAKANWDGSTLVIAMTADFGGSEIKLTDKWTLSEDGKTLTVTTEMTDAKGMKAKSVGVYDKQ